MAEIPKLLAEWFWTDRWTGSSAFLLPLEARGLYREMLTQAWRRGGHLPQDPDAIRRAVGCTPGEWRRSWPKIEKYWQVSGEFLTNKTQLAVIQTAMSIHESAVTRGRQGGLQKAQNRVARLARRQKPSQSPATAGHLADGYPPSPSPSPSVQDRSPVHGGEAKTPLHGGPEVHAFLAYFCETYPAKRAGAKYLVRTAVDVPQVKRLLATYGLERLKKLALVLLTTDEDWISDTDRGIGILSLKAAWLDDRLAQHEARRRA